eukprot:11322248-Prorocentrum_lima.AAC.1
MEGERVQPSSGGNQQPPNQLTSVFQTSVSHGDASCLARTPTSNSSTEPHKGRWLARTNGPTGGENPRETWDPTSQDRGNS